MKKRLLILIMAAVAACVLLVGCGSEGDFLDRDSAVKVVFNLEGGKYQNSPAPIVYYYGFKKGTENLIKNPAAEDTKDEKADKFNNSSVKRDEYYFDGWYRTKEEAASEDATPWDFKKDRVTDSGVVLYAKWVRIIRYTYGVYYIDDDGVERKIGQYDVNEGDKFDDYLNLKNQRPGSYTPIGYKDADGNDWDENFTHPGGDVNTEIKIYVEYTKGKFVEVSTAADLVRYASASRDIRLTADIDMNDLLTDEQKENGDVYEFDGFIDFANIFDGNGHTIKNFKLTYSQELGNLRNDEEYDGNRVLAISLFGATEGAEVKDVTFENVTIDVDVSFSRIDRVIVAPITTKSLESSFTNVSFSGTYAFTKMPESIGEDNFIVVDDRAYFYKDEESTFTNVVISIDNQIQKQIA